MTSSAISCLERFVSDMLVYTLRADAVETHWAHRARCVHAVDAQWQLFARPEHAMSAPWPRSQSPVRTPWHLHVMENVKLFAIFSSIVVQSHGALRNFKSPCKRRGIAVECDRGLETSEYIWNIISFMPSFYVFILAQAIISSWQFTSNI